jgi:hypothetical protein
MRQIMMIRPYRLLISVLLLAACTQKKDAATLEQERTAMTNAENLKKIDSLRSLRKNGDMVTRSGIGWDSDQIRDFQVKDKSYTHAGLAKNTPTGWTICHVTGRDSNNQEETVIYENIDSFLAPKRCTAFGHYRFTTDSAEAAKIIAFTDDCYQRKIKFDYRFDMKSDSMMTCSEMVAKAVTAATAGRIAFGFTPITERRHIQLIKRAFRRFRPTDKELIGRPIITIDDLTTQKDCKALRQFVYLQ